MQLRVPCTCKQCPSRVKRGSASICCFPINSDSDQQIDITAYKAPKDGIPEWCPILKVNEKLSSSIDTTRSETEEFIRCIITCGFIEDLVIQ